MRVPRGYRRNEKSPFKGIDTINTAFCNGSRYVEMKRARLRALTHIDKLFSSRKYIFVEMKRARLRALTHSSLASVVKKALSRNEKSPFKGIDTHSSSCLLDL